MKQKKMKGFLGEWLEKSGKVKDGILTPMVDMLPEDRELAAAKLYD